MVDIRKALGTDDAGNVLVQPEIDKVLQHIVEFKNPLRQNLPRKRGSGPGWYLNRRVPGTTGAGFVGDKDNINEDQGQYTRVPFLYQTIAAKGKVTRKMQAIGRSYLDILAEEMESRLLEFKDYEDWALFRGNSSTDNQFDGLDILVTQYVSCSTGTAAGSLTLAKMDEAIDKCSYNPNMIIVSKRSRRALQNLLQQYQRFVNVVEVRGGFKLLAYGEIPIFVSTNIVDTMLLNAGGTAVADYTSGDSSSIYILDTEYVWVGELTPVTVMPLAKTTSQYDDFDIYEDIVPVMGNTKACTKIIGVGA